MLRTSLAAIAVFAAIALAPAATADDLNNAEVVGSGNQAALLLPTPAGAFDGYASGGSGYSAPVTVRVDENGNRVYGAWINNDTEFIPGAGTQQQYTVDGNTQKHPYKTGCPHC